MNKHGVIHHCAKHGLTIARADGNINLLHHGERILFTPAGSLDGLQVLKKLYNRIVDNHNQLNINYRKKP